MVTKSLQLQWLEILDERCQLNQWMKGKLIRAQLGYEGEQDFEMLVNQYLPRDWILLHDLTFKRASRHLQIDFILVTPHGLYLFEIKNFKAYYRLISNKLVGESGNSFKNIFYQVENGIDFLKGQLELRVPIEGQVVFMSEQDTVDFNDQYKSDYIKRWHLEKYFQRIKEIEGNNLNVVETSNYILENSVPSHKGLEFEGMEWLDRVRPGIICEVCKSGKWKRFSRHRIKCTSCGHVEDHKRAIFRTICDYQTLYYNKKITLQDLHLFMGKEVNYNTLSKIYREYVRGANIGRLTQAFPDKKFYSVH